MYRATSFCSLIFIIYSCILSSTSWAKSTEPEFDNSFYISKICTSYMTQNDAEYCDDGYILKSETLANGQTKETVLMDGVDAYGWNHISINKIDTETYHVYVGCGTSCGANMLFGRDSKEQDFGLYFDRHANSRCTIEYDNDKKQWVARRFFSSKGNLLPLTYDSDEFAFAAYPKYRVEFDQKGRLIVKENFSDEVIQTLPNPCSSK